MIKGSDVSGTAETLAMFSVATVFLLLASLVAAAGFAVVAQRRLRQLGMLAAVGATGKHLRLVLLDQRRRRRDDRRGHRDDCRPRALARLRPDARVRGRPSHRPAQPAVGPGRDGGSSQSPEQSPPPGGPGEWSPASPSCSRSPGRPPKPRPARHSAIAATALIVVGIGCLALSDRETELLIVAGLLATILGSLLLGPLAIRTFSAVAGRVSIAPRLALRDLARYQARSGAALAAVTLSLGIAATVVVIASAEEAKKASEPASVSDRQIRIYLGPSEDRTLTPVDAPAQLDRLAAGARGIAAQLDGATVIPLRKATEPGAVPLRFPRGNAQFIPTVELTRSFRSPEDGKRASNPRPMSPRLRCSSTSESTPQRSIRARTSSSTAASRSRTWSSRTSRAARKSPSRTSRGSTPAGICSAPTAASHPPYFITLNGLRRHGWAQIPAGWLVQSSRSLTSDQIADARDAAAEAGLTIETRRKSNPPTEVMAIATVAGALLALAILAMTVGLIRGESAGDLRTLTAAGATSGDPPHADGHDRRCAGPARSDPRGCRRLRRPAGAVPRRPRLSE